MMNKNNRCSDSTITKPVSMLLFILLLLPFEQALAIGLLDNVSVDELMFGFGIYVAPMLLIIHRLLLVAKVKRSMYADSEKGEAKASEIHSGARKCSRHPPGNS